MSRPTRILKSFLGRFRAKRARERSAAKVILSNLCAAGDGPALVEPLKDQTVVSPESAKFTAAIRGGEPRAEVRWSKAGKALSVDGVKYVAVFEGEEASLTVAKCELSDAGEYSFTATNKVGSVTSKAALTVHGR